MHQVFVLFCFVEFTLTPRFPVLNSPKPVSTWPQQCMHNQAITMRLLPDTWNSGLRMRRESRERFPRHRFQRKPLVSDPGMHHGTCVTHARAVIHVGIATHGGGENVTGIPRCVQFALQHLYQCWPILSRQMATLNRHDFKIYYMKFRI